MNMSPTTNLRRSELGWLAASLAVLVILAAVDLLLPRSANISGGLVVAPFLASVGARPRAVIYVGSAGAAVAVGLAIADSSGLGASEARIVVIVVGSFIAAEAARLRIQRERRLADLSRVAETAQRAIIRQPAPRVGSVAVAATYQSSARSATVGGDLYEALDTPFGTRLLVGDVRGHGLASVRLAALIVGGFRALAFIEPDLVGVARELDLLASRYSSAPDANDVDGEEFVTAVLCDVTGPKVTLVNCGHPSPLLIHSDGKVRTLHPRAATLPLGLGSTPILDSLQARPGSRMLLYTDGLIESRDNRGRFFDLDRAAAVLARGSLSTGIADLIKKLNAHAGGHVVDDVALLAFEPLAGDASGCIPRAAGQRPNS